MWTRKFLLVGALAGLAACTPAIPDSAAGVGGPLPDRGRGVGFDANRDLALSRSQPNVIVPPNAPAIPTAAGAAGPVSPVTSTATRSAEPQGLARQTAPRQTTLAPRTAGTQTATGQTTQVASLPRVSQATTARPAPQANGAQTGLSRDPELVRIEQQADANAAAANSGQNVVNASPSNAAPQIVNNPGISSEQDFNSVSSQRTIEADAARIASNRAQFEVVQPTDLPQRSGGAQPNIIAYALQTSHARGTRVHRRVTLNAGAKFRRNCAVYASDDDAQVDFLANGGPARDRKGLDPDGDGFACGWDPAPYRRIGG